VTALLHLGALESVLGVPGSAVAGRIVALEHLWGAAPTRRLLERLAVARSPIDAAKVLEAAITERLAFAGERRGGARLAVDAAPRLTSASVSVVAAELGVSERHLRRQFLETVGIGPKQFAKLARFHRALSAVRERGSASWASIASAAGYYDQAHLIADFRALTGVTPQALLRELRAAAPIPSSAPREQGGGRRFTTAGS
jgi:AraC-like DNA-binding protein